MGRVPKGQSWIPFGSRFSIPFSRLCRTTPRRFVNMSVTCQSGCSKPCRVRKRSQQRNYEIYLDVFSSRRDAWRNYN